MLTFSSSRSYGTPISIEGAAHIRIFILDGRKKWLCLPVMKPEHLQDHVPGVEGPEHE